MADSVLSMRDLTLGYDGTVVVPDFTLDVSAGEFVSLLGPSGCGKSTVLRAIAGFLPPMSGQIVLEGRDITRLPPERRDVGIVFQNYALFPTMTAFENIAFGLRVAGEKERDIRDRVGRMAETAGIADYLDRKPANLSGGQQQRVAIARALIMGSRVLLFDEPLSNLDAKVRITMRREIKRLQREIGFTAIFVTHDQEEALSLSDRIVVLNDGRIEQIGTPRALYCEPATPFIAGFIGAANELSQPLADRLAGAQGRRCFVKHEDVLVGADGVAAQVVHVEFLGPMARIDMELDGHPLSALSFGFVPPAPGNTVEVTIREGAAHLFGEAP